MTSAFAYYVTIKETIPPHVTIDDAISLLRRSQVNETIPLLRDYWVNFWLLTKPSQFYVIID